MSDTLDIGPEEQAALLDMAKRYIARRSRQGVTGASVTRTKMTPEERRLHAARNDARSMTYVYERARRAVEAAERELATVEPVYRQVVARLEELERA